MTVTGLGSVRELTFQLQTRHGTTEPAITAAETTANLCYLCNNLNLIVASPDPDPNPRRGGQLPNPNECSSRVQFNTNESNFTLTSII